MKKRVQGAEEMGDFAANFVARLQPDKNAATVVALSGELGAGKTTFAQAAARSLGVEETVNSPTFVIEKIYSLSDKRWQRLVHIDAYRLKSAEEFGALGWDELAADKNNLIIIEWPENVPDAIPESTHKITIEMGAGDTSTSLSAGERSITYGN